MTRRGPSDRWALGSSKRLVAHRPPMEHDAGWGPQDGEPVGVPSPCARLVAGYWCSCGAGFLGLESHEQTSRARVERDPTGAGTRFLDSREGFAEPRIPWPTRTDRRLLQDAIEELPIGTIVERHGDGIAVAFGDAHGLPTAEDLAAYGDEPW